ncbi:MAG TPA: GNAT family N-acetyltransferase [Acidimicrobiales bacterium]|nr:GNAT family N-acetyltransferase [Acidimicrobiales bacterium]
MSSTTEVVPLAPDHLDQLTALLNAHLDAVVPGFALPASYLAERLIRDPGEAIVDPWVLRRRTLVAVERDAVVAAAHLLRYGATADVGPGFRDVGEVAWLLARPSASDAAGTVLAAGLRLLADWGAEARWLCTGSMFVPTVSGVPDSWPHIAATLRAAGYAPEPAREEVLYAGGIDRLEPPPAPPIEGLVLARQMGDFVPRFAAELAGESVGLFDVGSDATAGGLLPALAGWAEPWNLWVDERYRSRGVGSWLVRSAAPYLRLGGCDRMLLSVAVDDDRAGAGRFYERLGLVRLARLDRAWTAAGQGEPRS